MFEVETWLSDEDKTIAFVRLQGLGNRVINHVSGNTYRVISGAGQFAIGDHEPVDVHAGSVIHIPAGVPYQDEGDLVMLCTSKPPFDPEYVYVIE